MPKILQIATFMLSIFPAMRYIDTRNRIFCISFLSSAWTNKLSHQKQIILNFLGYGCITFFLASCTSYQPRPLDQKDLTKALAFPNKKSISSKTTKLYHPRIKPISIDFSKPLTPRDIGVISVVVSPDLRAYRTKNGVAQAQVFSAGLLPDPQLAFTYQRPLYLIPNLVTTAFDLGLNWDIGALVTTQTNLRVVKFLAEQVRYDVAWQEWLTANQAELLATRIIYLQRQIKVIQRAMNSAKHVMDITYHNLVKHDTTIDQFGLRQATYLDFLDETITLERNLRKATLQLNQILGLDPKKRLRLRMGKVDFPILNDQQLFAEAQKFRLDLLALKAGYLSQEAKLYQAILGQFPHFTMGYLRSRDNTDIRSNGMAINFDIPIINRNQGNIRIAKSTRHELFKEYIARLNNTRSSLAILTNDIELIIKEIKILKKQLPEMENAERQMRKGVSSGNITVITYQSILTSLLTNQIRLLSLKQSLAEQKIGLQMALGRYQGNER